MALFSSLNLGKRSLQSRFRGALRVEALEDRKLMAADLWTITGGDSEFQHFRPGVTTSDGSLIATVDYQGTIDLAPNETVPGNADILTAPAGEKTDAIVRYSSDGTFQWAKQVEVLEFETGQFIRGGISVSKTETADGGFYVLGRADGIVDFDPENPNTESIIDSTGLNYGKAFVARFDAGTGEFEWLHEAAAVRSSDSVGFPLNQQMAVDRAGSVYFAFGGSLSQASSSTANLAHFLNEQPLDTTPGFYQQNYIASISSEGVLQRVQHLGSYEAFDDLSVDIYDAAADPGDWRVIVSASAGGKVYLGDATSLDDQSTLGQPNSVLGERQGYFDADTVLVAFTTEGSVDWAKSIEGSLRQWVQGLAVDDAGTIYLQTHSYSTISSSPKLAPIQFDQTDPSTRFEGELDFAATFDISGEFIAADLIDSDVLLSLSDGILVDVSTSLAPEVVDDLLLEDDAGGHRYVLKLDKHLNATPLLRHDSNIEGISIGGDTITAWGSYREDGVLPDGSRPELAGKSDVFATKFEVPQPLSLPTGEVRVAFEDSFETGSNSNDWNGNWNEDSQNDWFRSTQRSWSGSRSAEVDGRASDASLVSKPVNLSEYKSAELSFFWYIESGLDTGEYIAADVWDGSTWTEIRRNKGNESTENTWGDYTFRLGSEYLIEDFRVRFRGQASSSREDANVDDVRIRGIVPTAPPNYAPTAVDDSGLTDEDQAITIDVMANDSDPEDDALTIASVTQPSAGTTAIVGGQVLYTPSANYEGSDSFSYTIVDTAGNSASATVDITITPVNDAPVSVGDSVATAEDTPVTINVLANDSDIDGDALTLVSANNGANGSVVINADQTITYTPNGGFFGNDSFSYTITDGNGETSTSEVLVAVEEQNDPPVANDDSVSTNEDTDLLVNVLGNDSDPDGDSLAIQSSTQPSHGSATIVGQQVRYSPNLNFNGSDSFTYTIVDTAGNTATATVNVTVTSVNDVPVASSESYVLDQDTTLNIEAPGVLANDSDVDGDALTAALVAGPTSGSLTLNADGSFSYTPDAGYVGNDSFSYQAVDSAGAVSAPATVSLKVNAVATGPKLSHGEVFDVSNSWQTVTLAKSYDSAVIVATPRYNDGSGPGVVRISNVTTTSFDVRVDNVGTSTFDGGIHFIAIEEGVYDVPGEYKLEAVKVDASDTSRRSGWQINSQNYAQSYNNPVVVGQVMSANDEDWSAFWSSSSSRTSPANSGSLNIGKHVAEDSDTTRAAETLGYFVIESTSGGTIDGLSFSAGVGSDTIRGAGNGAYQYNNVSPSGATTAVLSSAGMDGNDGGWAVLRGDNPLASNNINLSIDEDQFRDSERNHTTEQVAYFVIGGMAGEGEASGRATPKITIHDPLDVDGDGFTSPIDALQVINALNAESAMLQTYEEGDNALDTNGDGHVSPIDALLVINKLNGRNSEPGGNNLADSIVDGFFADFDEEEDDLITLGLV